uniref:CACN subunit beta associated regulatory protein b n=1 Tax=Myripristis murdjan TaxID=586833 RepID=A0A667WS81_9TELE
RVENYVLLLVLLCVFAGGTLVLLSLLLLFCHRCCMSGRRYSRASDDPEKTNTTYVEDSQPTQEITIRLDESDALSASSCRDGESERFVSTASTGRRVSFNETALYEQEKKTQDKGRRYTLTEGDFHHLKKARLTHLHLAPAPSALKILTIMECESAESSTININETPEPKLPLAIYQPPERGAPIEPLDWMGQSLSGGLPGDPHHSIILDQSPRQASSAMKTQHTRSQTVSLACHPQAMRGERELSSAPGQTSVLHFFSKLRRHASLEGAGPYFRKWKFDSSHRAASLDAKGSPKRRPFQRQRAASETTDHTEDDASPLRDDVIQPFTHASIQTSGLQSLSAGSLSCEAPPSLYRDIWSLRASLEQYASSDQSSTDRESIRSDADSVSSLGGESEGIDGSRKLLQMDSGYASIEAPSRAPDDLRLFGTPGGPRGKTASERRLFFTNSGRKGSVCDSIELQSQPTSPLLKPLPQASPPLRPRLRRRDYSIDEKTDALFNEFLRHDPRFDQQDSPLRSRHRSRVHLRKQWQRHKQYSDPGSGAGGRYSPSLERQRFTPLRRGDSAGYPLDTRYHSTLSRIASAADEEANEVAACEEATKEGTESKDSSEERVSGEAAGRTQAHTASEDTDLLKEGSNGAESTSEGHDSTVSASKDAASEPSLSLASSTQAMDPRVDNRNNNSSQAIQSDVSYSGHVTLPDPSKDSTGHPSLPPGHILQKQSSLTDKLAMSVEERLYTGLRSAEQRLGQGGTECVVAASHTTSPGHSPV